MIPRGGYVEVEGGSLYYEMLGEGRPIVLIHAGISDRRMWDEQFSLFVRHYTVLRYDVRGFGRSPLPTSGTFSVIDDLRELLSTLEIETAALVGVSWGAASPSVSP